MNKTRCCFLRPQLVKEVRMDRGRSRSARGAEGGT